MEGRDCLVNEPSKYCDNDVSGMSAAIEMICGKVSKDNNALKQRKRRKEHLLFQRTHLQFPLEGHFLGELGRAGGVVLMQLL